MPTEHPAGEKMASTRPLEQVLQDANEGLDPKKKQTRAGESHPGRQHSLERGSEVGRSSTERNRKGHYGQTVTKQGTVAGQPGMEDLTGFIQGWEFLGKMQ